MGLLYDLGDYYMPSETTDQRAKQEQPQPKVVQLNEEFHPFQLRIENAWSLHEALPAGRQSEVLLQAPPLPDLLFRTVIRWNPQMSQDRDQWQLWVESNKRQLFDLGLMQKVRRRPAIFGASPFSEYGLNVDEIPDVRRLRVQVVMPYREYEGQPDRESFHRGEIEFTDFSQLWEESPYRYNLPANPVNEEELRKITAKFVMADSAESDEVLPDARVIPVPVLRKHFSDTTPDLKGFFVKRGAFGVMWTPPLSPRRRSKS